MKNRRVVAVQKGGPEVLNLIEEEIPKPSGHEVCIRILAAGVSFADILMREGVYSGMPDFPFSPGYDIVGVVESKGSSATKVNEGDYVAALSFTGGYADYILLDENELVPVPKGVEPAEAVSLVLNYVTAFQMLNRSVTLKKGDSILVHGAAGGVGTALLQLAKLKGLYVVGTASSSKHKLVRNLNATPIDYNQEGVRKRLQELQPDGYNAVFDGTGIWGFPSYKLLNRSGSLILYGISGMLDQGRRSILRIIKTYLRISVLLKNFLPVNKKVRLYQITKMKKEHPEFFREDLQTLFAFCLEGRIKPVIASRHPLSEAAYCHELLNKSQITGKMVLVNE